jgi:chitinase
VGDIDGDGKRDLVTANRWSNNVSVLINDGNDATGNVAFQSPRNSSVYGNAEGIAVGDFNADGKLDLAATSGVTNWGYWGYYSSTDGYVNVLLGNGDGTFAAVKTTWANNTNLGEVVAADFNGDGHLDVATPDNVVQAAAVDPTVLLGRGDGTFDPPYHFESGYNPTGIVAADLNGDLAPDVSVATQVSSSVSVLLNDRNWPSLGAPFVSVGDVAVTEGNTGTIAAVFTVSLSAAFTAPISIQYRTADDTATAGSDYQATSGVLTFNPGGSLSQTVSVLVNGDRVAEHEWFGEHFFVNLSNPLNVRIGDGQGTGTIIDNEPLITIGSVEVLEGNTGTINAIFPVTLTAASSGPVTVSWYTADGWAISGSDYQASSGTLTFNAGAPLTQSVSVPVDGDRLGEYDWESFYVFLGNGLSGIGTILDDEPRISINDVSVTEGHSGTTNALFTVSLSRSYDEPVDVNFSTAEGDTAAWTGWGPYGYYSAPPSASSGSDFQPNSGTVSFAPGQTSRPVSVEIQGDRRAEVTNEFFSVDLAAAAANAIIIKGHGLGKIEDDEPWVSIDYGTSVTEGNAGTTSAVFTARMAAAASGPVTVEWSTVDGSAVAGSDYVAASGTLTFNAGVLTQTFSVAVNGDRLAEYEIESLNIKLGNGGYGVAYIQDNEPRFSINDVSITEGNSGTKTATFTVSLSLAYDEPVSVNFSSAEGDTAAWTGWGYYGYYSAPPAATSGIDFQSNSGPLTFAKGQTSRTINVVINGELLAEEDEYFSVNLSGASANASISDAHAVGIIVDDEPRVSANSVSVTEGNSGTINAVFTVTLSAASNQTVTVEYSTADGTATAGNDYVAVSGLLTFSPGQTSKTVPVAVKGDVRDEYDEHLLLTLIAASGARIAGSGTATIYDNDAPPSLRIGDASVTEGNSGTKRMNFTVTLSTASDKWVSVYYATANGSAKVSDKDYLATSGWLYFAPGETTMTISVEIKGDKKKEKNENFYVNLTNAYDAVFADSKGLGNILNDD